ncbi:MAG: helix-turn-helix domain-containing protein [Lachnospiraceae bacterium]|nr:helix-turn-helix domain-containing protein [Lachnospiraceae bacterium]
MRLFTINEVAMMTGFTTRTLRNYISAGILEGEKIEGVWKFSVDDFTNFISNPNVISGIKSKRNAQALDFLAGDKKKKNYYSR